MHTDEHGWPTQLEQWTNADGHVIRQMLGTLMFHDLDGRYPAGVYRAEWDGNGNIASGAVHFDSDNNVVVNHGVTAEGRNFADVQVTPDDWGIHLIIAGIDPADPIRNINIWMPDYQGQSFVGQREWAPGADFSPFHPLFLERLQPFDTLRLMQLGGACDTSEVEWSERRELTDARQVQLDSVTAGTAIEYRIELANQMQTDAWFNMPHTAGDEYVWNYATMVRDTLDPELTVYVEWSNEPFNDRPEYPAYHWVTEQLALRENAGRERWEFTASEIRRDMAIWSEVFAGQEERMVRVVSGFTHVPDVAEQMLSHMNGEFDALAVAAYVQPDFEERELYTSATTADQVTIIADSSESGLVPNSNIEITGNDTDRTLSITTESAEIPGAMVSLLVVDANGGIALETFQITIIPGGDPPPPDENTPPTALDATRTAQEDDDAWIELWQLADDAETPFEQLQFTFSNIVGGTVERIDPYTAIFTPRDGFIGSAGFDYQVSDNGAPPLSATAAVDIAIISLAECDNLWLECELQL